MIREITDVAVLQTLLIVAKSQIERLKQENTQLIDELVQSSKEVDGYVTKPGNEYAWHLQQKLYQRRALADEMTAREFDYHHIDDGYRAVLNLLPKANYSVPKSAAY